MSLEDKITLLITAIEKLDASINKLLAQSAPVMPADKLIPLTKWNEVHQWPTTAALRNIVFNEKQNGASSFIVRLGRRIYIDQQKFFDWARAE